MENLERFKENLKLFLTYITSDFYLKQFVYFCILFVFFRYLYTKNN